MRHCSVFLFTLLLSCTLISLNSCKKEDAAPTTGDIRLQFKATAPTGEDITANIVAWDITVLIFEQGSTTPINTIQITSSSRILTGISAGTYRITAAGTANDGVVTEAVNDVAENVIVEGGKEVSVLLEFK